VMLEIPVMTTLAFGFVLGLRHALDADHVAAVATLAVPGDGLRRALASGMSWGFGHALTIGLAGGTALVLRSAIPERLALVFEFAVGLMLLALGVMALRGAVRDRVHVHQHRHDDVAHAHLHFHAAAHAKETMAPHRHAHPFRFALRPFLVGSLHGLAGSAALALLVLATIPSILAGCLYLVLFGAGSTLGMMLMSLILGAPLLIARRRALWMSTALRAAAGLGSLGMGLSLAWRMGIAAGILG
jgi:high-affinity nickel permease